MYAHCVPVYLLPDTVGKEAPLFMGPDSYK